MLCKSCCLSLCRLNWLYEGCLLSDICRSTKQKVAVWFTFSIDIVSEMTLLYFACTAPVVCGKIQRHFDSVLEAVHGSLNWLWGPECQKCFTQPTFLRWEGTTHSCMDLSRDCFASFGLQWPWLCEQLHYCEGEQSYWCHHLGAADAFFVCFIPLGRIVNICCSECWLCEGL